jgi:RHS repeat-associated protein
MQILPAKGSKHSVLKAELIDRRTWPAWTERQAVPRGHKPLSTNTQSLTTGWCASLTRVPASYSGLESAPRGLINPDTGNIAGRVEQSLYGRRSWHGEVFCPLLFAGQYQDVESGWVYNRFRYYDPTAGVYSAQDPLGVAPRVSGAQGYVDNAAVFVDKLGLLAHKYLDENGMRRDFDGKVRDASEAGKHPVTGVPFNDGFPVFYQHVYTRMNGGKIETSDVNIVPTGDRRLDFKAADQEFGFTKNSPRP